MARVTLVKEQQRPDLAAVVAKIRKGRDGRLLNLYRALLNSSELAAAWFDFNNAVRFQTAVGERLRELVIMRVAVLNGTDYVIRIHKARYAESAGVTPAEVEALHDWRSSELFDAKERALLAYVDAMTRDVAVREAVFESVRARFNETAIVELTVLAAAYNMHTRVLKALDIDPETE